MKLQNLGDLFQLEMAFLKILQNKNEDVSILKSYRVVSSSNTLIDIGYFFFQLSFYSEQYLALKITGCYLQKYCVSRAPTPTAHITLGLLWPSIQTCPLSLTIIFVLREFRMGSI